MLVLSRYKDQSIYIGDDIVVTIVDVRGDRIRLGIEAPPNVPVHRQEIYEAIQRENAGELEVESVDGRANVQTLERTRTVTARSGTRTSSADYEVKLR